MELFLFILQNTFIENAVIYLQFSSCNYECLKTPRNMYPSQAELIASKIIFSLPSLMSGINSVLTSESLVLRTYFVMLYSNLLEVYYSKTYNINDPVGLNFTAWKLSKYGVFSGPQGYDQKRKLFRYNNFVLAHSSTKSME